MVCGECVCVLLFYPYIGDCEDNQHSQDHANFSKTQALTN